MKDTDIPPLRITPEELALAAAAKTWDDARRVVVALEQKRNELHCLREISTATSKIAPCWKAYEWDGDGNAADPTYWCTPCVKRQKLYVEIKAARAVRGAKLRALYVAAARWKP